MPRPARPSLAPVCKLLLGMHRASQVTAKLQTNLRNWLDCNKQKEVDHWSTVHSAFKGPCTQIVRELDLELYGETFAAACRTS